MIRLLNNNQPFLVLLLLAYAVLFNLVLFTDPSFTVPETDFPFSKWLFEHLNISYNAITAISIALVFIQALMITQILNDIKFFNKSTYVPGVIYIVMASMFREFLFLSPVLIANTFIILTFGRLFSMYRQHSAFKEVYDTGLLIGISTLIYFPSVVLFIAMLIALGLLRSFIWREWLVGFFGLITPYYLAFVGLFLSGGLKKFIDYQFGSVLYGFNSGIEFSLPVQILGGIMVMLFIGSFFVFQNNYLKSPIQVRKYLVLTAWMLILLSVSFLFKYTMSLNHFLIITVPLSLVISYFILNVKRWYVAEVVHAMLMITVLVFQHFPIKK
ncbi:MAG: DUF6427 family protein [Chitinophagales bacterium]|nr:DUF6427 family protein [Chitinophagales bacterium]